MDRVKIERAAQELFTLLLEIELNEAETVAAFTQALTMRLAYASKDLDSLIAKLELFPEIFLRYARANLSAAQSSILAKLDAIKGIN